MKSIISEEDSVFDEKSPIQDPQIQKLKSNIKNEHGVVVLKGMQQHDKRIDRNSKANLGLENGYKRSSTQKSKQNEKS